MNKADVRIKIFNLYEALDEIETDLDEDHPKRDNTWEMLWDEMTKGIFTEISKLEIELKNEKNGNV